MKKITVLLMSLLLVSSLLIGCSSQAPAENNNTPVAELDLSNYDEVLEEARGTTVNFYGWGGSTHANAWVEDVLGGALKEQYDITLNRVSSDIDQILTKLLSEKQLNADGTIDVVWINGENFFTAMENDLLYGPFLDVLPNANKYLDFNDPDVKYDFGFPTDGYEAPYGKAQMVLIMDQAKISTLPTSAAELLEVAKANPGMITYPAPPDFTGSAFVRNIVYEIVGHEQFIDMPADYDTVKEAVMPAMEYLLELKPYLWRNGETYPSSITQAESMFADGEIAFTMSYNPNSISLKINTGEFPETSKAFLFDNGTIGNTHYLAIPKNSTNKAAALVLINEMLSVESQVTKMDPNVWGDLAVLDVDKLNDQELEYFNSIELGPGAVSNEEILTKRLPEVSAKILVLIEQVWEEVVLNSN